LKPGNLRGPLVAELTASTAHMKTHNRRGPLVAELTAPTAALKLTTVTLCSLPNSPLRKHASRGLAPAAVCSLPNAPLRLHASGARLWGLASGAHNRRDQFVAERSAPTVCFWGLPLGPRNHAICSLPNSSPRLHASWDSQPPAARSLPNLRRDRKLSGVATAAACSSPNTPPRPPNLRAAIANELPVSERSAATSATHRCRFAASCSPHCTRQRGASGVGSASRQS